MDHRHETVLSTKLARRLTEEVLTYAEIEALGELTPAMREQRDAAQSQLDEIDRALLAANRSAPKGSDA